MNGDEYRKFITDMFGAGSKQVAALGTAILTGKTKSIVQHGHKTIILPLQVLLATRIIICPSAFLPVTQIIKVY